MTDDLKAIAVAIAAAVAVFSFLMIVVRNRNAKLRDALTPILTSAGWSDLRSIFMVRSGLRGTWRSLPAELAYGARNRHTPERLILYIGARSQALLIVKRRTKTFWTRPLILFGPPLVELHQPSAQQFWVRSDEVAFADRLFGDEKLVKLMSDNLVAGYDEIRIDGNGLRITRAVDERPVREKYNIATFRMTFDPERFLPIAREEVDLAQTLAGKLA